MGVFNFGLVRNCMVEDVRQHRLEVLLEVLLHFQTATHHAIWDLFLDWHEHVDDEIAQFCYGSKLKQLDRLNQC